MPSGSAAPRKCKDELPPILDAVFYVSHSSRRKRNSKCFYILATLVQAKWAPVELEVLGGVAVVTLNRPENFRERGLEKTRKDFALAFRENALAIKGLMQRPYLRTLYDQATEEAFSAGSAFCGRTATEVIPRNGCQKEGGHHLVFI